MKQPGWYAQPFRADGGITADGLLDQLGRPRLSRLTMLVREAAQNSWDARRPDRSLVSFRLNLGTVSAGHVNAWRLLFADGGKHGVDRDGSFRRLARARSMRYLAIEDRGTVGLGGPTRSDAGPSERVEWLRFILNSGDRDGITAAGPRGGTFGYGKGALYQLSRAHSVLVYTRFENEGGRLESRFIGVGIREAFWESGRRYTGRQWWGIPETNHCEPLRNEQADAVAHSLGLRGFDGDETGTTLIVVDPDLTDPTLPVADPAEELTVADASGYLAGALAWNLWPIMLTDRVVRMSAAVTGNGVSISVPSPEEDAALAFYASAFRKSLEGPREMLSCRNPRKDLGVFAFEYTFGTLVTSPAARELGLDGAPHHVCLIRGPELVTRYHAGPERSNPDAGYAGVFKVVPDLDETFARAEPPTHDGWEFQQLKGKEATFVRTAGRRLRERCDRLSGAQARRGLKVGDYVMGSVAQRLGHLLAGPGGTGTAALGSRSSSEFDRPVPRDGRGVTEGEEAVGRTVITGEPSGPSSGRHTRRPVLVSTPRFDVLDGRPVMVQQVLVRGPDVLEGVVKVLTGDGRAEDVAPRGAPAPEILGWRLAGRRLVSGAILRHTGGPTEVELIVSVVADVLVEISVTRPG